MVPVLCFWATALLAKHINRAGLLSNHRFQDLVIVKYGFPPFKKYNNKGSEIQMLLIN